MNIKVHSLLLIVVTVVLFVIYGCGGSAGDSGDINNSDSNPTSGQKINGDLTGYLYTSEQYEGWLIDLETGRATQAPQLGWFDIGGYTGISPSLNGHPNEQKTGFLLVGNSCFSNDGGSGYLDCFMRLDSTGNIVGEIITITTNLRDAKLSKDGNYVAITHADDGYVNPFSKLIIFDSSLQIVSQTIMRDDAPGGNSGHYESGFEWMENGQILYAYKKSIYITGPYSTEGSPIITLPESSNPENDRYPAPAEPRVSPDGSKVAFRYVTGSGLYSSQATIWVMNIDGTDPHQLVHIPESDSYLQVFNNLDWSPDGNYILVAEGAVGDDPITGGKGNRLYAIPSGSRDLGLELFNCDGNNGVVCVRTYFKSPDDLTYEFKPYSNVFEWIE